MVHLIGTFYGFRYTYMYMCVLILVSRFLAICSLGDIVQIGNRKVCVYVHA